jgi:hypothetical protein
MVVMGWDAEFCVRASVFGFHDDQGRIPNVKGLLDHGFIVVTSRNLVCCGGRIMKPEWKPLTGT